MHQPQPRLALIGSLHDSMQTVVILINHHREKAAHSSLIRLASLARRSVS